MQNSNKNGSISTPQGSLHYVQYGIGSKTLLVFHGFGQNHTIAVPLSKALQGQYTIYGFDLPYHGLSSWKENESVLTKTIIRDIFKDWLRENSIHEFSVFGYSMGGKFAISLTEQFPRKVKHLVLAAPDGLFKSRWYGLIVSWPIKSIFRRIIDKPKMFFHLTKLVRASGLIHKKLIQFGESQMATRQLRAMVYYTWHNFQKLFVDNKAVKNSIENHNLKAILILGKMDNVIIPKNVIPEIYGVGFEIILLEAGHAKTLELTPHLLKKIL